MSVVGDHQVLTRRMYSQGNGNGNGNDSGKKADSSNKNGVANGHDHHEHDHSHSHSHGLFGHSHSHGEDGHGHGGDVVEALQKGTSAYPFILFAERTLSFRFFGRGMRDYE